MLVLYKVYVERQDPGPLHFFIFYQLEGISDMQLCEGKTGFCYTIEQISLPVEMEHRLEALGMTIGTKVLVVNRKGRGILIIKLRGTRFALGYNITKNITVRCEA